MKISFLYGAHLGTFAKLLVRHKGRIAIKRLPSFLSHLLCGVLNTICCIPELFWNTKKTVPKDITFIMGHYRSGTSHLLNLLTEEGTHVSPNNYQSAFPYTFLSTEKILAPLLSKVIPAKRPMDNMTMEIDSPQEEEIAMAAMGGPTPYLAVHFPKGQSYYRNFISFKNAQPEKRKEWQKRHLKFVRKLGRKHGVDRPLVLKSPANTARIEQLLEIYPNAKFIYIHRNPYKTILSSRHLYNVWYTMDNFQSLDKMKTTINEDVYGVYEEITKGWLENRDLIKPANRTEIAFADLQKSPIEQLTAIYAQFNKPIDQAKLATYLKTIATYKKNVYEPLNQADIELINTRFAYQFNAFDYEQTLS